ncbi:hypothetical protein ACJX0J_025354, partial [Zea mays]
SITKCVSNKKVPETKINNLLAMHYFSLASKKIKETLMATLRVDEINKILRECIEQYNRKVGIENIAHVVKVGGWIARIIGIGEIIGIALNLESKNEEFGEEAVNWGNTHIQEYLDSHLTAILNLLALRPLAQEKNQTSNHSYWFWHTLDNGHKYFYNKRKHNIL